MKTKLFLILTALFVFLIYPIYSYAQYKADTQWKLPKGAKARLGKGKLMGKPAYSPDGARLALATSIGIWLIDIRTGQEVAFLTGHGVVFSVAFSPDGKTLASGSEDSKVRLWEVATGAPKATLVGHNAEVLGVAFSPDGKTLASWSDTDGTLRLWDVATGGSWDVLLDVAGGSWDVDRASLSRSLYFSNASIVFGSESIVFGPDGKNLLTTTPRGLSTLWSVSTSERKATYVGYLKDVLSAAFSPDGKTIATGSEDYKVQLWDTAVGPPKATLSGHLGRIESVAFSPDGKTLATGSQDRTLRLWDVATRKPKAMVASQSEAVICVTYSPDGGTLATASRDGTVQLLEADTRRHKATLTGHPYMKDLFAAYSPDGETLTTISVDGKVRLWDTNTQKLSALLTGYYSSDVLCIAFSPDGGTLASGSENSRVQLWDVATGTSQATLTGHLGRIESVAFSPDGEVLATTGSYDGTVRLWNVATRKPKAILSGHRGRIENVVFSPDGETLATRTFGGIQLLDADTGQHQADLYQVNIWHIEEILVYSPDSGTLIIVDKTRETLRLWDAAIGKPKATLSIHPSRIGSVAFSPDGETFATGSYDGAVQLRDVATGKLKLTFTGHSDRIESVAFSPDREVLATGSYDGTVRLWNVATGASQATFTGHSGGIESVVFSPDGETLASGSTDGTVLLWNLAQGKQSTQKSVDKTRKPIISDPEPEGVELGHQEIKETPVSDPSGTDASLVLHFSFDELKGHLTIDHSQYQNHGTLVGNPQLVAGKFGNALKFNGQSDWVEVPHADTLNVSDEFTIMAWIHTPRHHGPGGSRWQGIVSKSNNPRSYSFYTTTGGSLHLSVGEYISSYSDGKVALNEWQHVAVQVDNEWQRFWINGENVGDLSIDAPRPEKVDTASVRIGNTHDNMPSHAPDRHFRGIIDEIRIYNRALSKDEIIQQMRIGYE